MSRTEELKRELPPMKHQTASTRLDQFPSFGFEGEVGEDLLNIFRYPYHHGWVSLTSTSTSTEFSSEVEYLVANGLLTSDEFDSPIERPGSVFFAHCRGLIAPMHFANLAQVINAVAWIKGFTTEQQEKGWHQKEIPVYLSEGVLKYCSQHHIFDFLQNTLKLVQENFSGLQRLTVERELDPDAEDDWLVLNADIESDIDKMLSQYDEYTRRYVKLVPWPKRDKIRFSYNLL